MGATSTMYVTRDSALTALAKIEHSNLDDDALAERLTEALNKGGYSLDEVRVSSSSSDWDTQNLDRIAETIAR